MRQVFRVALAWLALVGAAHAQQMLGAGQVLGNNTAARAPAQAASPTSILDRAIGSTRGSVLRRGASGWEIVVPSATVGLPWVSAGTGADPLYQVLGVVGGGTGINLYAIGDITCATGTTTLSRIADVATGQVLRSGGVGVCPAWGAGVALTKVDDTNVTATLGGSPTIALVNAASITLGWTGQLSIARGGTGQASQTAGFNALAPTATVAGSIIYWNGTNWVKFDGNTSGSRVFTEDASGVPSWATPGAGTVTTAGTGMVVTGGGTTLGLSTGRATLPTVQSFAAGASGTYTTPANVLWIEIEGVGGGGGGAGSGTTPGATSAGGNTCWNTSGAACTTPVLLGSGGPGATTTSGGVASCGTGSTAANLAVTGGSGGDAAGVTNFPGSGGGGSYYGGGGVGGGGSGQNGKTGGGYGTGGGGAGQGATNSAGAGGAGGCFFRAIINTPAATYTYAVGAAGGGGTLGTGGAAGAAGIGGRITVTEHYGS